MYCSLKNGWKKYQVRLWLSIFFTCYIPNSFILEFSGCSASYNHSSDNNCLKAIDGSTNDGVNSWGTDIFPAWAIFELKEEKKMNSIVLMSGSATACWALLLSFKVTLEVDGQWIQLNGLQVKGGHKCGCFHNYCGSPQPPTAQIETDGTVTFLDNTGLHELTLEFTTVTNVQSIRLDVNEKRDPSLILKEIIPRFIGNL